MGIKWAVLILLACAPALADTPPPGTVNSALLDGTRNPITSTVNGAKRGINTYLVNPSSDPVNVNITSGTVTATNPSVGSNAAASPSSSTQVGGSDGTNLRPLKVSATGVVAVDGSAATQPISAASLPLPSGASTSALQTAGNASLTSIDGKLANPLPVTGTFFQATQPVSGSLGRTWSLLNTTDSVNVGNFPASFGVTQITSPWVTSRDWTLGFAGDKVDASGSSVSVSNFPATQAVTGTFFQATQPVSGVGDFTVIQPTGTNLHVVVDSAPTTAVTGTFFQATQPVSAAALPLPSGASTSANQATEIASLSSIDGKLTNPLPVSGTVTTTNTANGATGAAVPAQATQVAGSDGTNLRAVKVSSTGVVSVDGSATTQPVSGPLTDAQLRATAVPVSGTFFQATQPVSGPLTDTQLRATAVPVSGPLTDAQLRATAVPVSGAVTANVGTTGGLALDASVQALQVAQGSTTSGQNGGLAQGAVTTAAPAYTDGKTDPLSLTPAGALRTDGSGSTQPVSGSLGRTWTLLNTTDSVNIGNFPASFGVTQVTSPWVTSRNWNLVFASDKADVTGSSVSVSNFPATQTVAGSGNFTVVQPTGTNLHTVVDSAPTTAVTNASLPTIATNTGQTPINATGTQVTGTVSTVITLTAPAGATGFILQATDSNTANMRWAVGATATTTVGQQLQPGRDTGYVPLGANISIVAESGTQEYEVQWVAR